MCIVVFVIVLALVREALPTHMVFLEKNLVTLFLLCYCNREIGTLCLKIFS